MNLASPKTVKELLEKYSLAPLKRYGQNFLIDGNIADKIAKAAVPKGAFALEIGPGLGALTQRLLERCSMVAAYEIDSGLVRSLNETFEGETNFKLFHEDFLKADIQNEIKQLTTGEIYVAANLPYYITTDCVMKLICSGLGIKAITLMVQTEFAEKMLAPPGSAQYGMLSAIVEYFASVEALFDVAPSCFYPKPHVSSSVVRLEMKEVDFEYAKKYMLVLKSLYSARRKTVKSNLRRALGLTAEQAETVLKSAEIDDNARAETLSAADVQRIVKSCNL
ncbi:MAG: 16S rRNA (adenine(1518)-N(6)/adenine(1519)-N(6))-dimethyltransferase RsmA [Burkholderiales bacterium]